MPKIVIANTPEAIAAAQAMAERRNVCIQEALDIAETFAYCICKGCSDMHRAEVAAEMWAEGAWLRAAEDAGPPCQGRFALDGGCLCC